ncbi:hypothetical protein Ait01nite_014330 [Actinoplanes italicus]|uniref:Uncharacterized protein n=1 Tax=Actinoplanes italicus TaxID=113567 RepID=A0A2T0KI04_9ACTN|nr:hypothetical protein [Actinoplanes italicus]PRX22867.1 hypothetical protein CLV67_104395 [Actinoplanes italicus]GIE28388.1 hypothetical protein Ait01nite_014330 [Actinoplanes italicus]
MADQVLDVRSQPAGPPGDDPRARTHSYLRAAMAALLISIGVAVIHQTIQQSELLGSVSGYYYTPVQAVFVGGLMALGVAMIALRGTNDAEEVALNLGGMCAILVAVVPTSRNQEQRDGVEECRETLGGCPDLLALEQATRANVENNMVALLVLGFLGLVAAFVLVRHSGDRAAARSSVKAFWWGFAITTALWLCCVVALLVSIDWFIEYAHHIAAVGLLACLCVVALANAQRVDGFPRREQAEESGTAVGGARGEVAAAGDTMLKKGHRSVYSALACLMIAAGVLGAVALVGEHLTLSVEEKKNSHTLFWVEIVVAALFIGFWLTQTWDLHGGDDKIKNSREEAANAGRV